MKKLALVALVAAAAMTLAIPAAGVAAGPAGTLSPTGQITGTTATGGTFTGTLSNLRFVNENGALAVVGTLTGTLTNAAGQVLGTVTGLPIDLPVAGAGSAGGCTILDLTLGPLHLDLLGLVVDLNQIHLTITGQQGPGNLVGNLLCGLANALNANQTGALSTLLNRLLGV
jgi:hypothetical protein